jgi:hypothetical protein
VSLKTDTPKGVLYESSGYLSIQSSWQLRLTIALDMRGGYTFLGVDIIGCNVRGIFSECWV